MQELFKNIFSLTIDPAQRLYWPFLISSALVVLLLGKKKTFKDLLHPSSLLDIKILGINLVLKTFIFPLILFSSFSISLPLIKAMRSIYPLFQGFESTPLEQSILITILAFTLNDFLRFLHHFLMHRSSLLFKLHQTHHSALVLTPFTLFRTHPLESFMASARNIISLSLTIALTSFLFKERVSALDILGVNAFGWIFNAALANLRHSPIPISFGPFEYLFISPRMHQIHHSSGPQHFGKNFGVALSIWDLAIGTFYRPNREDLLSVKFGLYTSFDEEKSLQATTLKGALLPYLRTS